MTKCHDTNLIVITII